MNFDIAIIGCGVAGVTAALRIADKFDAKVLVLELNKGPAKRRRFLEGYLGCMPVSSGMLHLSDLDQFAHIDGRKLKVKNWLFNWWEQAGPLNVIKDSLPSVNLQKKIAEQNFEIKSHDYIHWKPEYIHKFSKITAELFEENPKFHFSFDNQVLSIEKQNKMFNIHTELGEFNAKKILFCPGRSGWRWSTEIFKQLDLKVEDDYSWYGVKFEISGQYAKELNQSHCSLHKEDVEIGKFDWKGTVIPEDHADLVCSTFRNNEERWKSEKVSFNYHKRILNPGKGVSETERIAKLVYLLFNDRVSKEKIKIFLKKKSQLNLLPEFDWLESAIEDMTKILPNLLVKGSYHIPSISCYPGRINLNENFESDLSNFYVVGESANVQGILGSAMSSIIAIDDMCR